MQFLKFPVEALTSDITNTDRIILLHLLLQHFHRCSGNYNKEFYITDRNLAKFTGTSTRSIWIAKRRLRDAGIISFTATTHNKTYYKIISQNSNK